ncbi:MORN repeat-containing protein [Snuella sedimenti]|uniref:MORN repeat protein n=1 Tax=Snuella sedimenti TaxID=2798802 RepID=A0A8J7J1N6_9FLAO|nr:hypothetical protein [Snuella sedimenti]MBJ6368062.1 hypothetical protein [Snuella sedimenti]
MKHAFFIISFFLFGSSLVFSQSGCKIKLEAISSDYTGDCKNGYAHGIGVAKGKEDSYSGAFKKGFPHGLGNYNWGNGNTYKGQFNKGKMDGQGALTIKKTDGSEELKKGYFKNNEYIGLYKYPYLVRSKREIRSVVLQEDPSKLHGDLYRITIKVKSGGINVTPHIMVTDENGTNYSNGVMQNVMYPCKKIEISFNHESYSCRIMLDVYKKGNWIVEITI